MGTADYRVAHLPSVYIGVGQTDRERAKAPLLPHVFRRTLAAIAPLIPNGTTRTVCQCARYFLEAAAGIEPAWTALQPAN